MSDSRAPQRCILAEEAGAGDILVIQAGELHSFKAIDDGPVVPLDVHVSPRFIQENLPEGRRMRRRSLLIIGGLVAVACLGLLFVNVCADGGAMGSAYRTCRCSGVEWELYDRLAADGPRRTICLGLVRSTTCHSTRDGLVVPCAR